ncbi:hypothetical protein [Paraburkholderia sp. J11-2]|uniref:hypothetical protein n=1 Tax=Paraburkholderia sp. J11-2 TaxID=2805431 RepID=UPI002AB60BED|nr:hypothetical protein [Paraburkholderia sp. J11-2]
MLERENSPLSIGGHTVQRRRLDDTQYTLHQLRWNRQVVLETISVPSAHDVKSAIQAAQASKCPQSRRPAPKRRGNYCGPSTRRRCAE